MRKGEQNRRKTWSPERQWGPSEWILRCEGMKWIQLAQCRAGGILKTTGNVLQVYGILMCKEDLGSLS